MSIQDQTVGPARLAVPSARLLASDDEREAAAARLRDAVAAGRLTLDEADERQRQAYAARTVGDLDALTADLPPPPPPPRAAPVLTERARRRLAVHAAVVGVIAVMVLVRWATGAEWFFWPAFPMFWLGASLLVHHRLARRE